MHRLFALTLVAPFIVAASPLSAASPVTPVRASWLTQGDGQRRQRTRRHPVNTCVRDLMGS